MIAELVALGDGDPAREDDHEARSDLADGPKRFTGSKGAQVAEPTRSLDFERIERGINLVVPLFANGLQLRHNACRSLSVEGENLSHGQWSCAAQQSVAAHVCFGQSRTLTRARTMSALPPKADIAEREHHVRFVPKADSCSAALNCNEKGTCDEGPIIGPPSDLPHLGDFRAAVWGPKSSNQGPQIHLSANG